MGVSWKDGAELGVGQLHTLLCTSKASSGLRVEANLRSSGRRYQFCGSNSWSDLHLGSWTVSDSSADSESLFYEASLSS